MPPSEFDDAIAVSPGPDDAYDATLDDGWRIGSAINGGLLLALLGNAVRHTAGPLGHPDPLSISAYFLSAAVGGRAVVDTDVVRHGRTMTTVGASLRQHADDGAEVERIRALATFGDLASLPGDVRTSATPPRIPPPEECLTRDDMPRSFKAVGPFLDRLDVRLDPATTGWARGEPTGDLVMRAWVRFPDGREPDALGLLLAVDCLPPVTFEAGVFGWVPTLELTAHVRAVPAPGWLLVQHSCRNWAGGLLEEDAEVWDSSGRLVAQSRQLAREPR